MSFPSGIFLRQEANQKLNYLPDSGTTIMHFIMNSLYAFNYSCTGIGNLAIEENPIIYVQKYNILDINIRLCLLSGLGMGDSLRFQRVCLGIGTTQSGYQTCATGIARDYGAATGRERVLWNAVSYPPLCGRGSEDGSRLALRDGIAGPRMAADFSPSPGSRRRGRTHLIICRVYIGQKRPRCGKRKPPG